MLRVLYGTGNPAKLATMKNRLEALPLEIIGLKDIERETGIAIPNAEEDGRTPLENARQKAAIYFKTYRIPVFSCDSGLYCEELPDELQPGVHVRTVGGKSLTDEEMQEYYAGLAIKYGREIAGHKGLTARYHNAICFVRDEEHLYERMDESLYSEPFLLTARICPVRRAGFPLDSMSLHIPSGKFYYDMDTAAEDKVAVEDGFLTFFKEILSEI